MANRPPNLSEIVSQLPQKLQIRFNSLSSYVLVLVSELENSRSVSNEDPRRKLNSDERQTIQLIAFIYTLERFMRDGSRAARNASIQFEDLGTSGFVIGEMAFTRNNSNTRRGENLADSLRLAVTDQRLQEIMTVAISVRNLVDLLAEELTKNG